MKKMIFSKMDDFEEKLFDFKIMFAYHSGKIENNNISYHDTRDIFDAGRVVSYTGDLKTLYEIQNQKTCYEYLKPFILERKPLDISFIKTVHYKLTKGTYDEYRYNVNKERPGEFKKHDYVTGVHEVGTYPEEVETELIELLNEINDESIDNYFLAGVYFHAMFENIHPFADGNGRVGRTLMNYYFMIHDIAPVIIYDENKMEYYRSLEMFDIEENLDDLLEFVEEQQSKTWSKKRKQERKNSLYDFQEGYSEGEDNQEDQGWCIE